MDSERWNLSLNPLTDEVLCQSPRHSSDSGDRVPNGTDLLAHRAPSGTVYFYLHHWSIKRGESSLCTIIGEETAREFILERLIQTREAKITDSERDRILKYFPGIFNEEI